MNLENIIPTYNNDDIDVQNEQDAIKALDSYVSSQIHRIDTSKFIPKFSRLVKALQMIPVKNSIAADDLSHLYPQIKGHITLFEHCLKSYSKVLSGEMLATELLFPDGSFELVEKVYTKNSIADHFNSIVAKVVRAFLQRLNQPAKF